MICFECGRVAAHKHHVVPKSRGGMRTVPLCVACHEKVHGRRMAAPELVREGIERARARGAYRGGKSGRTKAKPEQAKELASRGIKPEEIARGLGVSVRTVFRYLRRRARNALVRCFTGGCLEASGASEA